MLVDATSLPSAFAIAGVDEVGRGPLAGPVVAAAVILDPRHPVDGLDDSKRLDEAERERLDTLIRRHAAAWCIAAASVEEIDRLNILHASLLAMQRAVRGLCFGHVTSEAGQVVGASGAGQACQSYRFEERGRAARTPPELVLVDGNRCPDLDLSSVAVVKGDGRVRCIGAASIIAKVARDRYMIAQDDRFPGYDFRRHKGYGTTHHCDALVRLGATPLHRHSFAPVRLALEQGAAASRLAGSDDSLPCAEASGLSLPVANIVNDSLA